MKGVQFIMKYQYHNLVANCSWLWSLYIRLEKWMKVQVEKNIYYGVKLSL